MDPILPTLIQAAPQYALAGYLIYLLTRVMGHASTDRGDYRADLEAAEQRHAGELQRLRESSEAEIASVRAALADVRQQLADVLAQLETERRARWQAEDTAAEARRLIAGQVAAAAPAEPLARG